MEIEAAEGFRSPILSVSANAASACFRGETSSQIDSSAPSLRQRRSRALWQRDGVRGLLKGASKGFERRFVSQALAAQGAQSGRKGFSALLTTENAETRMRATRKRFEKASLRALQPMLFRGLQDNRENGD